MTDMPPPNQTDRELTKLARAILHRNDRGGYTVPTARLYPFQWNWDSAFVAMGFATFDEPRAWQEITSLLRGQWADGMIPQIVFHAPSDDYFPGPDVWHTHHTPPTSGIPQPPVLASAARFIADHATDKPAAQAALRTLTPALLRNHRWWHSARDPEQTGLVATLHPWETGMDNSPAWDSAMARVPTTTTTEIKRRDTSHIAPEMRPRAEDYQRFIHLMDCFSALAWNPAAMFAHTPFKVADIGTNAILLRAEHDLLAIAEQFATPVECAEITARIARQTSAIQLQWSAEDGIFLSRDLLTAAPIQVATSAGFLPLWSGCTTLSQTAALRATLAQWHRQVHRLVPSTNPADASFEARRYWRGPVWHVVNFMIAEGFAGAGALSEADLIRSHMRADIAQSSFAEYFDPTDGTGLGGTDFSWTAAMHLVLTKASASP